MSDDRPVLLHVITRLSLGGSARNTLDSAAAAVRAGYRTILATGPSGEEIDVGGDATRLGCELVLVPSLRRSVSPVADARAVVELARTIRRLRPSIVHTHTSKAGFVGRLAARAAGAPAVVHTPHGHIFYAYYGPLRTRAFVLLERFAARLADRLVALTPRGIDEHVERGIGRREQWVAIPSGVDTAALRARAPSRTEARRRLGLPASASVVVATGRLVPVKGFDLLVEALPRLAERVPDVVLVLVGDGPERARLEGRAREAGVAERLRLPGATSDVAPWLAAADVLAAPSRNEGMGRSIVEAMCLGLPVVAARVGGIPSVVDDGATGLLVPPERPDALAAAIARILVEPALARRTGEAARARAELFSLPVMERALARLYAELSREKGLPTPTRRPTDAPRLVAAQ